jgi:hypothetical protein
VFEVDVSGREIAQALVITAIVVVLDESANIRLQVVWKIIVLHQDAVLERLMPTLDLALRLRMIRRAPRICSMLRSPSHFARSPEM